MSVSCKHIHTQTHTRGHSPLQAAGCRSISYCRKIYAQLQSTGVSCQSVWCQRGDPPVWVTAGGQDMTHRYAPTETAGSTAPLRTAWLLSKLHSPSRCSFFAFSISFSSSFPRFPSLDSRSVWWLNFESLEEVMTKTNAVSSLLFLHLCWWRPSSLIKCIFFPNGAQLFTWCRGVFCPVLSSACSPPLGLQVQPPPIRGECLRDTTQRI